MKSKILLFALLGLTFHASGQNNIRTAPYLSHPKLVVGIVVDQMKYEYLFRFQDHYTDGGFKRLLNDGFNCMNTNYNYVPTYTAPGHACIYTGTTPAGNGIISNEWYDRSMREAMYCVGDSTVKPVGTTSISGKMSPANLLASTVTDELRLSSNMRSKVIGVALKDRGAVLPAGRTANAAYWHDPYSNNFVTSTYYMNDLPQWVKSFNDRKLVDSLLSKPWTTLLPIESYVESTTDANQYEGLYDGEKQSTFPHDLPSLKDANSELIRGTPFGNTLTKEFALAAVRGENLGKGKFTDFLAVSFSSTDYIGHMYGTNAIELQDTYIRLDRDIAEMLDFFDKWVGPGNYIVFLTSDHGAALNPVFARDQGMIGKHFEAKPMRDALRNYLSKFYNGQHYVLSGGSHNIFLDREAIAAAKLDLHEVQDRCVSFLSTYEGVAAVVSAGELTKGTCRDGIHSFMKKGFNLQRSGDVLFQLQPGWTDWRSESGTTHSTAYRYDTHVPLVWYGAGIRKGSTAEAVFVEDIAPTLSTLLNIGYPNGTTGKPVEALFR